MSLLKDNARTATARTGLLEFPFHPILFSVYPILHVFGRNLIYVPLLDTVRSLALSIGLFSFLFGGFRLILKDWEKAGILSSLLCCLFYSFGHVAIVLERGAHHTGLGFDASVLAWIWPLVFLLVSFLVVHITLPEWTTKLLNIMSGALLVLSLATILSARDVDSHLSKPEEERLAQLRGEGEAEASLRQMPQSELPDIYYIILDAYVRADYLEELYDYDNSPFISALKQRGFYIVSSSRSNYLNTNYSLNASLNLMYFHELPREMFNKAKYNLYANYVGHFLQERGYRTVVYDSGYGDTNSQDADIFVVPNTTSREHESALNAFEKFLLQTIMGLRSMDDQPEDAGSFRPSSVVTSAVNRELDLRRRRIRHALAHLPDYASEEGRYFSFAHIYLPHIPFLYGPDGAELSYHENPKIYWYEVEPENYAEYYAYQIDYLNRAVLDTIDEILASSTKPVVIVLQSDHGDGKFLDRDAPTTQGVSVRSAILNAVYFSDRSYDQLYPTMTPVNTFRVVLNHWFGTQYPLLPDKVFFHEHSASTPINKKPEFLDACVHFDVCLPAPPK